MRDALDRAVDAVDQVLYGKRHVVRLAVACILAKGHLLLEDLPGMGKTTLSQALSRVLGMSHQRIQFTSDLLPADIATELAKLQDRVPPFSGEQAQQIVETALGRPVSEIFSRFDVEPLAAEDAA